MQSSSFQVSPFSAVLNTKPHEFRHPEHEPQLKQFITAHIVQAAQADHEFAVVEKNHLAYAGKTLGLTEPDPAACEMSP